MKGIETAQSASFLFIFLKNIKNSDVLSIGFRRDVQTHEQELTNDK